MSRKTKIVEEVIGLVGRELRGSRKSEALEETGTQVAGPAGGRR